MFHLKKIAHMPPKFVEYGRGEEVASEEEEEGGSADASRDPPSPMHQYHHTISTPRRWHQSPTLLICNFVALSSLNLCLRRPEDSPLSFPTTHSSLAHPPTLSLSLVDRQSCCSLGYGIGLGKVDAEEKERRKAMGEVNMEKENEESGARIGGE
jgi:hypothetical protein